MGILFYILFAAYVLRTVRTLFYHLFLWEIKEYRLDRMYVHLKETWQGHVWLFGFFSLVKWLLLSAYFIIPSGKAYVYITGIVIAMYCIEGIKAAIELFTGWKIPKLKIRIGAIFCTVLLIVSFGMLLPLSLPVKLLAIDKLIGPLV